MITNDKILHAVTAYSITLTAFLFVGWWSILIAVVLSLGKEIADQYGTGTPDRYDLLADLIGVVGAVAVCLIYGLL